MLQSKPFLSIAIGITFLLLFTGCISARAVVREPQIHFINDKDTKPLAISRFIGRRQSLPVVTRKAISRCLNGPLRAKVKGWES